MRRAACPLINARIIAVADAGDVNLILREVETQLPEMNLVNLATAMHRLARLTEYDADAQAAVWRHPVFSQLLRATSSAFEKTMARGAGPKTQALSNTIWALATLQVTDLALFRLAATVCREHVSDFKPFELSAILWSFAKLGMVGEHVCEGSLCLFETAANYVAEHAQDFSFRCLLMTAWSYATAQLRHVSLFQQMATHILPMLHTAKCQELANAAWAFSKSGSRHDELFSEIAVRALPLLDEFKPEELTMLLHSFASAGVLHERLFDRAAVALQGMDLQPPHLANTLWALSHMRPRHQSTSLALLALLPRCTSLLPSFRPQEISSIALAAGKCFGSRSGERRELPQEVKMFFDAASPCVVNRMHEFSGQALANMTAAFSDAGMGVRTDLFPAISRQVINCVENLENTALLLLLRSLPGVPRCTDVQGAVRTLFGEAARRMDDLQDRELRVLTRICSSYGGFDCNSVLRREELRSHCLAFSAQRKASRDEASDAGPRPSSADLTANPSGGPKPAAPLEVVSDHRACKEDAAATEVFRQCVQTAAALSSVRDEKAEPDRLSRAHVVCSVKNTFLDIVENSSGDDSFVGEAAVEQKEERPLPPSLDFISPDVSAEELNEYRRNYQRFRMGKANGAKGEASSFVQFVCD